MAQLPNQIERALTGIQSKLQKGKSQKDLVALQNTKDYPTDASEYEILDDCGRGVSATVHRARVKTNGDIVAVKLMNLESMNCDLDEIIHEAQTMRSYNHPNVLPLYCSFVHGQELWMVMPFVAGGSVLHIMKYAYPEGLDEVFIATIGREVLKGLDYVHKNGGIHRDVKAGNILVDMDGAVKLGDFGVAANLERGGSWGHNKMARMTFVGTPCWMAPEVMEQTTGYDSSADIWSFGITLLEMSHGHAPFAKFPPMKVLLMTLQNPAPTLEDKGKKHFSKALKDLVTKCLQKEPDKRPTAAQLLEHKFFKLAKDNEYLQKFLMCNLPTLAERVQQIRTGKAATYVVDNDRNLEKSQEEYRKGVSSWNFDLAALKAQAALEPDDAPPGHASSLPTISESDEREDTLTGAAAAAAAAQLPGAPVAAAAAAAAQPAYVSAFATMVGQEPAAKTNAIAPPAPIGIPDGPATPSSEPSGGAMAVTQSLSEKALPQPTGSSETQLSPGSAVPSTVNAAGGGGTSPAVMSREGSVTGSLAAMASAPVLGTTPTAVTKQKKGRFEVSEHPPPAASAGLPSAGGSSQHLPTAAAAAAPPPWLSAPGAGATGPLPTAPPERTVSLGPQPAAAANNAERSLATLSTGSSLISGGVVPDLGPFRMASVPSSGADLAGAGGSLAATRGSDDGGRGAMQAAASVPGTALDNEESVSTVEPKQRGRFKIVAEQGAESRPLSKAPSMANLNDKEGKGVSKSDGGAAGLGRPPPVPTSGVVPPPVSVVLPKLQELLDHATAHQAALQKLVGAVQDCDKGRAPLLFTRAQSTRSLFDVGSGALGGDTLDDLKARVAALEEENLRLRERNKVLEQLHGVAESTAALQRESQPGMQPGGAQTHVRFQLPNEVTMQPPVLSPRTSEVSTPHA